MTDILSLFIQAAFSSKLGDGSRAAGLKGYDDTTLFEMRAKDKLRQDCPFLTEEKIRQIGAMYKDCWQKSPDDKSCHGVLYPLVHFVKDKAVYQDGQLKVKLDELFRWRQLAFAIGEDMLVCAWLAYHFRWKPQERLQAEWNMSCEVYDAGLQYIYGKGLADLHHHLKASTDVFCLSWICLMNHITHRYRAFGKLGSEVPLLYKACYEAAFIRTVLYGYGRGDQTDLSQVEDCFPDDLFLENEMRKLQNRLNILRRERGGREKKYCHDYALPFNVQTDDVTNVFKGEHSLVYGIMRSVFRDAKEAECLSHLLFRYLQVKTAFRNYMVQTNKRVGFTNFSDYERRKDLFLEGCPEYERLLNVLPIVEGKRFHHLEHLETRIAPKADYSKMRDTMTRLHKDWKGLPEESKPYTGIIVHFIKRDNTPCKMFHERHHNLRSGLRRQAVTLMTLRRRSAVVYDNVIGIDAANTELDCRPEVFAQTFRYVRKHADDVCQQYAQCDGHCRTLHYTYHVGEDFYDIVDGLRAIDEAVMLLELESGDRLGHCLALGISPEEYYNEYNHIVMVKKQYLLDNIAWMIGSAKRLAVGMSSKLEMELHDRFDALVYELYGRRIDMENYRKSMLLRGDNPYNLCARQSKVANVLLNDWASCALCRREELVRLRENREIRQAFLDYHFDENVRKRGEEMESIKVSREYEDCVRRIQECMMQDIRSRNIIIECCPSSNVKIGYANRYDRHPIFRFCPIDGHRPQMPVTVNTDDLGIFQTSIDNEYSLLALAALKAKDKDGHFRFGRREVVQWLDNIRENGQKYAFKCGKK